MFVKEQLTIHTTVPCVVETIQKHIRSNATRGYVNENEFRIYKMNTRVFKKLSALFIFSGKISEAKTNAQITFLVRPCIPVFISILLII